MKTNKFFTYFFIVITGTMLMTGCDQNTGIEPTNSDPDPEKTTLTRNLLKSNQIRSSASTPVADIKAVTDANNTFGWALFNKVKDENTNLFFSPYSISTALAMVWVGAQGETKTEMAKALNFTLDSMRFHAAMNSIDLDLSQRGQRSAGREGQGFSLKIANTLWGENSETFLTSFLDPLAIYYNAGMRLCDFENNPELVRLEINDTVKNQTNGKIEELIPPKEIDVTTRLVITNTVYFDAAWADTFESGNTQKRYFYKANGDSIETLFMGRTGTYNYSEDNNFKAIELPYSGGQISMVVLSPKSPYSIFTENAINNQNVKSLLEGLSPKRVFVNLPKFSFSYGTVSLRQPLIDLGMRLAFSGMADFSGINGKRSLAISNVFHQAYIAVDEKGTTAAAATAVILRETAIPFDLLINLDHPFIFLIRDIPTNQILFIGYLANVG
jgi:serpin B